ncbi:MAG TPA: sigma factor-like helix-turn-helix DNA-binding protein [Chloroflexia bacterium]|nr:sigma factor-like helix-turn-helix DNA-binding protein [Chloroflexia bacterium]
MIDALAPAAAPQPAGADAAAYALLAQAVALEQQQAELATRNALALRAQAGDLAARDALYWLMEPRIRRRVALVLWWAERTPNGWVDVDDAGQQIFLIFCDLLGGWQPARGSFSAYIRAVLPYRLRHYVGRQLRPGEVSLVAGLEDVPDADPGYLLPPEPDIADGYAGAAAADEWLATLPVDTRRLVVLHVLEGQTIAAAAAVLGVSRRTAWRRLAAARSAWQARAAGR